MLGMDISIALGTAIFTESIFGLPGLGRLSVQSLETFDLPMIQGVVVFSTLCIIIFTITVDVAYAFIDPRIRLD
jgi:peptide/nickel transport system permease protein